MQYFFSYSRKDDDFARKLADDLEALDFDVWFDQVDIQAGSNWDEAIETGLNNAECMILILSSHSVTSENVLDEISTALARGKKIIPVRIEDCHLPLRISRLQHIDFITDYDAGIRHLTQTINSINAGKQNQPANQNISNPPGNTPTTPVNRPAQAAPTNRIADSHLNYKSAPPAPPQKSNKTRNILLISGGALLLLIILFSFGSGDNPGIAAQTNSTKTAAPATNIPLVDNLGYKVSYSLAGPNITFSLSATDAAKSVSIFVDVNQNKKMDERIDRMYTEEEGLFCSQYAGGLDTCGQAPSAGSYSQNGDTWFFTLPLDELRDTKERGKIFIQFQFNLQKKNTNFPRSSSDDDFSHFYEIPVGATE